MRTIQYFINERNTKNDRNLIFQNVRDNKTTTGYAIMADESVCLDSPTSGSGDPDPGEQNLLIISVCQGFN